MQHAVAHVPYYRELFRRAGLTADDIRSVDDLPRIPLSTKADLLAAGDQAWSSTYARADLATRRTSGTTGEPLPVPLCREDQLMQRALLLRSLLSVGFGPQDRLAKIGPAVDPNLRVNPLGVYQMRVFDTHQRIDTLVQDIRDFNPTHLLIQPSWLRAFATYPGVRLRDIGHPRRVLFTSEVLYAGLQALVQREWGTPALSLYGSVDCGILGLECESHRRLHVQSDQAVIETSPLDTDPRYGRVVVTSLVRRALPLLRYRLEDIVPCDIEPDCPCGSPFPVIGPPLGRDTEPVRLPSGGLRSPILIMHRLQESTRVRRYLAVQHRLDRIRIEIEVSEPFSPDELEGIRSAIEHDYSEELQVELDIVDTIAAPPGKPIPFQQRIED